MKIDLSHVLHWPPQPTTIAGFAIIGVGMFVAPEVVWPALVTGLIAIIGDDGTQPRSEKAPENGARGGGTRRSRQA